MNLVSTNDSEIKNIMSLTNNRGIVYKAQRHIFHGEVDRHSIKGFHHESSFKTDKNVVGKVKRVIRTKYLNITIIGSQFNVYEATVVNRFTNTVKNTYSGKSTFFDKTISRNKVTQLIYLASQNKLASGLYICTGKYRGLTLSLHFNKLGNLVTGFPKVK